MSEARAQVKVGGRVQGVFFRAETRHRAASLGVRGWVRNNTDGTVEAVLEGPRELVESMVEWMKRGPAHAQVESAEVEWGEPLGEEGFTVRGSGA